jgi:hypothetical protein
MIWRVSTVRDQKFCAICGFFSNTLLLLLLKCWFRPIVQVDWAHDSSASFYL